MWLDIPIIFKGSRKSPYFLVTRTDVYMVVTFAEFKIKQNNNNKKPCVRQIKPICGPVGGAASWFVASGLGMVLRGALCTLVVARVV